MAAARAAAIASGIAADDLIVRFKDQVDASNISSLQTGSSLPFTSSAAAAAIHLQNQAPRQGPSGQQQEQQRLQPWEQLKLLAAVPTGPLQDMPGLIAQLQRALDQYNHLTAVAEKAGSSTAAGGLPQAVADIAMDAANAQMQLIAALATACQEGAALSRRALQAMQLASRQTPFPPGASSTAIVLLQTMRLQPAV
jgi:hypothetical protein